jgi:hypothetical protein
LVDLADAIGDTERRDVELARGSALYRAGDFGRAAVALERLASEGGQPAARQAAAMYLVALHRIAEERTRPTCATELDREARRLALLHCAGADEDASNGPSVLGLTVSEPRPISPCEAIRAIAEGAPPPPLPKAPPRVAKPPLFADGTSVSGRAIPEYVAWVLRLRRGSWQACYDRALEKNPYVEGSESMTFEIARGGTVKTASAASRDHDDTELDACLVRAMLGLRFGQPEGGEVTVSERLTLSRSRGVILAPPSVFQP